MSNKKQDVPNKRPWWAVAVFKLGLSLSRSLANLTYQGQENLPRDGAFILAANHQSYLDGLWVIGGLEKEQFPRATALAGSDLSSDHGFIGKLLLAVANPIRIDRYGNPVRGLIAAKRALKADSIVLIHPEGSRTRNGFLAPCLSGAAYLSMKTPVPIIPVYISGAYDFFPRQQKWPSFRPKRTGARARLSVNYLEALNPADFSTADQLNQALYERLYDAESTWLNSDQGMAASVIPPEQDWTKQERPRFDFENQDCEP